MHWFLRRCHYFWFEPRSVVDLAVCRILFYGSLFAYYLPYSFNEYGNVSHLFWDPIWLFQKLHLPLFSSSVIFILELVWKLSLLGSAVGFCTRVSTCLSFVLSVYLIGLPHNFGKLDHFDAMYVLILAVLAISRCGDYLSIDRALASRFRGTASEIPPPSGEYTWPIHLVWVLMSLMYFAAGYAKLRFSGIEWVTSDHLRRLLISHYYINGELPRLGLYLAQYPLLCNLMAAVSLCVEFGFPLALVSRRARWVLVPMAYLLHVGIRVLMGPEFLNLIFCYVFWIPWTEILRRLTERTNIPKSEESFVDSSRPLPHPSLD